MPSTFRDLQAALHRKSGFEVINHTDTLPTKLRIIGRQPEDRLGVNMKNWQFIIGEILDASDSGKAGWSADVSKQYVRRGDKGQRRTLFTWRLLFEGADIHQHYDQIIRTIIGAPHAARGEVTEFPLSGSAVDRADMGKGKGAFALDRAPIGQNLQRGR